MPVVEKTVRPTNTMPPSSFNNEALKVIDKEIIDYCNQFANLHDKSTLILSTTTPFNITNHQGDIEAFVNLKRINDIRFINKFFEAVNQRLENGSTFIGFVETFSQRRTRKRINKYPILKELYFGMEFIFLRVFPKVPVLKKIYFFITRGRNRLLSKAETLGRLVSCGFEIIDYKAIGGYTYFVTKKARAPHYDMNPSYGPFYKMPRIGKNGKIIGVYKLRTMHPYAEYLHDYVLKVNGYAESGKPANDFRLTPYAKAIRRYWLDEIPQLINVLKGEMKMVGVRPVSERYFQDIPEDLQKLRLAQKPGCIPPYVALNRKSSLEEVQQAEREYLQEKLKNPYFTDTKYFFKAIWNIIVNRKRSA